MFAFLSILSMVFQGLARMLFVSNVHAVLPFQCLLLFEKIVFEFFDWLLLLAHRCFLIGPSPGEAKSHRREQLGQAPRRPVVGFFVGVFFWEVLGWSKEIQESKNQSFLRKVW